MTDDWSDEQWEASDAAIRAAAHAILDDGPLALDELTVMLAERGALVQFDGAELDELEEIVDDALIGTDDTWTSNDGRISLVRRLLGDVVLTHRVTASELDRGVLDSTPDLGVLMWWPPDRRTLIGGGEVAHEYPVEGETHLSEHGSYVGPDGWLDMIEPGEIIGVACAGEQFGILRAVEPDQVEQTAEVVRAVFDELCDVDSAMECDELVLESLLSNVGIFRTPTAPLSELIEQAGLSLRGAWVGRADQDFTIPGTGFRQAQLERLSSEYRLDTCCRDALERLMAHWSDFVHAAPDHRNELAATWDPRHLRDDFHHGGASPALVDYIWELCHDRVKELDEFAGLLSTYHQLEPVALYLVAHNALRGGEAGEALDAIRRSATLDGEFGLALDLQAILLADAGRPAEALSAHRRALAFGGSDQDVVFLDDLLEPFAQAGRNDPCPCGSGRKFKQCCQREPKLSTFDRRRLAIHQATWSLYEHHRRSALFSLAADAFEASDAPTSEMKQAMSRLLTDPFLVDLALFDEGGLGDYIRERAEIVPEPELVWLRSLAESKRSLWEYQRLEGNRFEMHDVRTGEGRESITLDDRIVSDQGCLLIRIVDDAIDGTVGVFGPGLEVSPAQRDTLKELLDAGVEGRDLAAWYGALTAS